MSALALVLFIRSNLQQRNKAVESLSLQKKTYLNKNIFCGFAKFKGNRLIIQSAVCVSGLSLLFLPLRVRVGVVSGMAGGVRDAALVKKRDRLGPVPPPHRRRRNFSVFGSS